MLGIAVSEEGIRIVDSSGNQAQKDVQGNFGRDQDPEVGGQCCAAQDTGDVGDDVLSYFGYGKGEDSHNYAEPESPRDNRRS